MQEREEIFPPPVLHFQGEILPSCLALYQVNGVTLTPPYNEHFVLIHVLLIPVLASTMRSVLFQAPIKMLSHKRVSLSYV